MLHLSIENLTIFGHKYVSLNLCAGLAINFKMAEKNHVPVQGSRSTNHV